MQHREIKEITGDEEVVRAYVLTKLVNELNYKPEKIEIEKEYKAGRPKTITSRIDIIVRDKKDNAFLFIETKKPEGSDSYKTIDKNKVIEDQLFSLSHLEDAGGVSTKYLVLYTASANENIKEECIIIDKEEYPSFDSWETNQNYATNLPKDYGRAVKLPYIKGGERDLETEFSEELLTRLSSDLHNVLWGGGGTDDNEVFSSLTNIILTKIQDEGTTDDGEQYSFQVLTYKSGDDFESNDELFDRLNKVYRDALKDKLYITDKKELEKSYIVDTKKFSLEKLKYAVQQLEGLSFVDGKNSLNGKDILGTFFENIIRDGFKQSKGQFFTPDNVVNFMLYAVKADELAISKVKENKELPYMIDPSAGSGTFLINYMKFITENLKYKNQGKDGYNKELGATKDVKDKVTSDWFYPDNRENKWAQTYIYGSEINFNLGTATKVNMILHGDGSTNIFVKDGLLEFGKYVKETAPNALGEHNESKIYNNKEVNGKFDILFSNPLFSVELDNDTKKSVKKNFIFGEKKNSENLFIERYYQLLKQDGRLAVVLPDSVFDTTENKYIRLFIYKFFKVKAVVSLPQLTFEPYTSTKTSILFAQKKTNEEVVLWNEIWGIFSKAYSRLQTRIKNILDVYDGKKQKEKLKSIKNLSERDEINLIHQALSTQLLEEDEELNKTSLLTKYRDELKDFTKTDSDKDVFGFVNSWWVFQKTTELLNYNIFMAEVDNIGYKRTKRGIKTMPNELYSTDDNNNIIFDTDNKKKALDYMREIEWDDGSITSSDIKEAISKAEKAVNDMGI